MNANERLSFRCIGLTQPIGSFYIGAIDASDLLDISWADVQRIEKREVETFLGIERPLSPDRVKEIERYVRTVDATFPTSVLLAVSSDDAEYDEKSGTMTLRRAPNVAKIIDGQHRIAGLREFSDGVFEVNVTVFVDMDIEDQAMVFATINLKQTKVSRSMAYNLYEYATSRSPQKTCHDLAKLLNGKCGSPFKDKIKILGTATPGKERETLTQAAFVDELLPLISRDPEGDRDLLKRRRKPQKADPADPRTLVFRNMFIDEQDAEIARVIWNYFAAVSRRWERAWTAAERGLVLNRRTGFAALMRLLPIMYLRLGQPGEIVPEDEFYEKFRAVTLKDGDFSPSNYVPGSSGQGKLFDELRRQTGLT
jgi:DGQHR domain-containing protein